MPVQAAAGRRPELVVGEPGGPDHIDHDPAELEAALGQAAQFRDPVQRLLHRHLLKNRDEVHRGLRRADHPLHGVGVGPDRPHLGQPGHLGRDIEETADPPGRRGIHHHRVVDVDPTGPPPGGLGGLAGQQHVPQPRRDRGREVDDAEPGQGPARVPQVVEHLQVLDERRFGVGGQRVDVTAGHRRGPRRHRHLALSVGQRRAVEQLGDALPALHLHEQDPAPGRGQSKGQRAGHRRLAGAALAGDDVQPHAFPVGIASPHRHQAILAHPKLRTMRCDVSKAPGLRRNTE